MASRERIGVALFGVGRIGKIHLKNLLANKRIRLEWIVDQYPESAETALREIGAQVKVTSVSDIDNVLKDPRYVYLCLICDIVSATALAGYRVQNSS